MNELLSLINIYENINILAVSINILCLSISFHVVIFLSFVDRHILVIYDKEVGMNK